MGILKKLGKLLPGTGKHAAKRAAKAADQYTAQAEAERKVLEDKARREKARAQKLAIRGMRSKRAASRLSSPEDNRNGSMTIG